MEFNPGATRARPYEQQEGWNQLSPALAPARLTFWNTPWPRAVGELTTLGSAWCRHGGGVSSRSVWEQEREPSARQPVQATHGGENWTKTHLTRWLTAAFCGHWRHDSGLSSRGVTQPHHYTASRWCPAVCNYRKAREDAKESADVPPTVLAIASHCSGPTPALTSVDLFPSVPSGLCRQQRELPDEPARLTMRSWVDPASGWELAGCCRRCSGPFGRGGVRCWWHSRLQGDVKQHRTHSTLAASSFKCWGLPNQ